MLTLNFTFHPEIVNYEDVPDDRMHWEDVIDSNFEIGAFLDRLELNFQDFYKAFILGITVLAKDKSLLVSRANDLLILFDKCMEILDFGEYKLILGRIIDVRKSFKDSV